MIGKSHFYRIFKSRLTFCLWWVLLAQQSPALGWTLFSDPAQTYQHLMPAGDEFPGSVPKEAERVTKTIRFSLHPRGFSELRLLFSPRNRQSTGLYRVPGEPITFKAEPVSGSSLRSTLYIRIGAHTDELGKIPLSERKRVSMASDRMELQKEVLHDRGWASGLIYLESDSAGTDSFDIIISGAVKAPWFKLGRDSLAQWLDEIRYYPVPWAELEGEYTILTLPSAMIRDLDDPVAVVTAYDQLVKDANALVGLSPNASEAVDKAPDLPFRFVIDIQTKVNTHSHDGYPIVLCWLEAGSPMQYLDLNYIRTGFILRHELGHNYEPADTAFEPPGASQAFANLFISVYQYNSGYWFVGDRRTGEMLYYYVPAFNYLWDICSAFIEGFDSTLWNPDVNVMCSKKSAFVMTVLTSLTSEPITELYRQFRHLPEKKLPSLQQEKTDYFFESLCEHSGQDLTLLFKRWLVPVSPEAYQRVSEKDYRHPRWLYHDGL